MTEPARPTPNVAPLRRRVALAIWLERVWPPVLFALLVAAAFCTIAWFGLFRLMPDWARIGTGALALAGIVFALFELRHVRAPSRSLVNSRIESANRLPHQALTVQDEALAANDDAFGQALWAAHRARQAEKLRDLGGVTPKTGIAARDPYGLRAIVVLLAFTGLLFSYGSSGGRLGDVLRSHAELNRVPPRIDAWVTPPTYTGKAPIVLTAANAQDAIPLTVVPAGSKLLVRVTGGTGQEQLTFARPGEEPFAVLQDTTAEGTANAFSAILGENGEARLTEGDETLFAHVFTIIPDAPPTIRFADPQDEAVSRAANGALELRHEAEDDYALAQGFALLSLTTPQTGRERALYEAPEIRLSLPPRGETLSQTTVNLTDHPWAGMEAELVLQVTDAAGQLGESESRTITLPMRPFSNPLARAIAFERRVLALDANKADSVHDMLDIITLHGETTIDNAAHYLAIRSAMTRLELAQSDDEYRDVADYLWQIALNIENGGLTDAERRLREAQQALREALQNGASDAEISQRIEELRQAMNDYLREFAERALAEGRQPQDMPQNNAMQNLQMQDLDRMLDQMEQLAQQGAREQAEQMLSQLENMLNNLQMGQQNQAGQQGQGEMQQQLNELGEILRRQQELMDETMQAERGQQGEDQQGRQGEDQQGQQQPGGEQGQNRQPGQGREQALRQLQQGQGELQQRLQDLMDGLGQLGIEPSNEFEEGSGAMGRAGDSLGEGDGQTALGEQGQAMDALRRGAEGLMQQLQQMQQNAQGEDGGGDPNGQARGNDDRDPLGRPRATTGPDFGNNVKVPDEIDVQRAREILEEIRRRLGDTLSPQQEKDYLERLLDFNAER